MISRSASSRRVPTASRISGVAATSRTFAGRSADVDLHPGAGEREALHAVAQLADVAGPGVAGELGEGVRRQPLRGEAGLPRHVLEEALGEHRDRVLAVPQRRDGEGDDLEAVVEVGPEAPALDERLEVALLAASRWMSTAILRVPPTRRNSRRSSARRSLAWQPRPISLTSSRKSVPPSAVSMTPSFGRSALVKAPRSWPKSSLSSRGSASVAQFTATKGPSRRGPRAWMARAISSLPVPLSPEDEDGRLVPGEPLDGVEQLEHRPRVAR